MLRSAHCRQCRLLFLFLEVGLAFLIQKQFFSSSKHVLCCNKLIGALINLFLLALRTGEPPWLITGTNRKTVGQNVKYVA